MNCDIIIPVWNQLAFTKDCIDSILKNTDTGYRVIIIDNASDDKTRRYLEDVAGQSKSSVSVVRNEKNLGFVKAANQGIALSKSPYICLLNNDTLVMRDWLKVMIAIAESRKDIGIVNPSSNNLGQKPSDSEPLEHYAGRFLKDADKFAELGAAIGFCMLIKREVIQRIGVFDEIYGMGNFEDTDFSRRAINNGYRCVRACGAYVYHRENTSFGKLKTYENDFKRNKEIFEFRWGRPRRVAYIIDGEDENVLKRLTAESLKLARNGNWIWYFSKSHLDMPDHSNIRYLEAGDRAFYLKTVIGILKKKKKFDEIFVGEDRIGGILERLTFIHKAKISYY